METGRQKVKGHSVRNALFAGSLLTLKIQHSESSVAVISSLISRLIRLTIPLLVLVPAAGAGAISTISVFEIVILRGTEAVSSLAVVSAVIYAVLIAVLARGLHSGVAVSAVVSIPAVAVSAVSVSTISISAVAAISSIPIVAAVVQGLVVTP